MGCRVIANCTNSTTYISKFLCIIHMHTKLHICVYTYMPVV